MAQQHINYSTPNDGLGDTLRTSQVKAESNFNELYSFKVDKIAGKELSDTNFTQAEKDKLAGLTTGGQVQSDWDQGDNLQTDYIKNKPTNVSEWFNDVQYITDVPSVGSFVRSAGEWLPASNIQIQPFFFPVLASTNQNFEIPIGKICIFAYINQAIQLPADASNVSKNYTFTQLGNVVTLKTATIAGNLITLFIQ
jgi:hypothetical protein